MDFFGHPTKLHTEGATGIGVSGTNFVPPKRAESKKYSQEGYEREVSKHQLLARKISVRVLFQTQLK